MPESDTSSTKRKSKYERVLSSENWQDFVVIHVPQLYIMAIEDNYANLLIKEIKNIFFFSIAITRDHARKDQNRSSIIKLDQYWSFFFDLLIKTHGLELGTISLTYFVKIFVNNPAKKTKIITYLHWSYVW